MAEPTKLDRLTAQRDRLTLLLEACEDGSKAAALSRELRALDQAIDEAGGKKGGDLDDLAARRAARLAEAPSSDPSAVRK